MFDSMDSGMGNIMTDPEWGGITHNFTFGVFADSSMLDTHSSMSDMDAGLVMDSGDWPSDSVFGSDSIFSDSLFF
jgi:hypothetical protein